MANRQLELQTMLQSLLPPMAQSPFPPSLRVGEVEKENVLEIEQPCPIEKEK